MSNITYKNSPRGLEKAVNIAPILERQLCIDFSLYVLSVPLKTLGLVAWLKITMCLKHLQDWHFPCQTERLYNEHLSALQQNFKNFKVLFQDCRLLPC